jgi:hypothetical protein
MIQNQSYYLTMDEIAMAVSAFDIEATVYVWYEQIADDGSVEPLHVVYNPGAQEHIHIKYASHHYDRCLLHDLPGVTNIFVPDICLAAAPEQQEQDATAAQAAIEHQVATMMQLYRARQAVFGADIPQFVFQTVQIHRWLCKHKSVLPTKTKWTNEQLVETYGSKFDGYMNPLMMAALATIPTRGHMQTNLLKYLKHGNAPISKHATAQDRINDITSQALLLLRDNATNCNYDAWTVQLTNYKQSIDCIVKSLRWNSTESQDTSELTCLGVIEDEETPAV